MPQKSSQRSHTSSFKRHARERDPAETNPTLLGKRSTMRRMRMKKPYKDHRFHPRLVVSFAGENPRERLHATCMPRATNDGGTMQIEVWHLARVGLRNESVTRLELCLLFIDRADPTVSDFVSAGTVQASHPGGCTLSKPYRFV